MVFRKEMTILLKSVFTVALLSIPGATMALPFNDDMADTPALRTGEIVRPLPIDSVPMGSLSRRIESKEEALKLTNPKGRDPLAIKNGERLFAINCQPCHGKFTDTGVTPSAVNAKSIMAGPDIGSAAYAVRPDGLFYGTIHFGGLAVMPRVGFKLSPDETWDIVSYIRSVQRSRKR